MKFDPILKQPGFDIEPPTSPTTLVFQLTVTDNHLTSDPDTVTVRLFPIESTKPALRGRQMKKR